jgi:hypothetical protein
LGAFRFVTFEAYGGFVVYRFPHILRTEGYMVNLRDVFLGRPLLGEISRKPTNVQHDP